MPPCAASRCPRRFHRTARALRPARVPALVRPGSALAPGSRRTCRRGGPPAGPRRGHRPGRGGARRRRRTGADVVGVDLNEPMLRAGLATSAGRAARPGAAGRGRADQLPFADATFDAVTFSYLLRYVDDPAATIAEMARCLRPGGTMASLEFAVPPQPGLARGLVVLHPAGPARARRPHRRRRLVPGGALPGPEHLGSLPALPPRRARRRLARGLPYRRRVQLMSMGGGLIMWGSKS